MGQQFPLKPLDQHHDLATWHRRSEEALLRHYSDQDHMDRLKRILDPWHNPGPVPPEAQSSIAYAPWRTSPPPAQPSVAYQPTPGTSIQYQWPDGQMRPVPPPQPRPAQPSISYQETSDPGVAGNPKFPR